MTMTSHPTPSSCDPVAKALHDAATSLETIASLAGRKTFGNPPIETYMDTFMDVRLYAASRARAAREEPAASAASPSQEQSDTVLVRLKRPEGYEDVHPELVLADANINPAFEPEIVPAGIQSPPAAPVGGEVDKP